MHIESSVDNFSGKIYLSLIHFSEHSSSQLTCNVILEVCRMLGCLENMLGLMDWETGEESCCDVVGGSALADAWRENHWETGNFS
jgi:hypothetical protein